LTRYRSDVQKKKKGIRKGDPRQKIMTINTRGLGVGNIARENRGTRKKQKSSAVCPGALLHEVVRKATSGKEKSARRSYAQAVVDFQTIKLCEKKKKSTLGQRSPFQGTVGERQENETRIGGGDYYRKRNPTTISPVLSRKAPNGG